MRYALEVWCADFETIERTCIAAEQLGFDAFYYGESPHALNLDCWTTLAALARCTSTIRLGPVISNLLPDYRSLALLGRQVATLAILSAGRVDFRTGAGADRRWARRWWEPVGVRYPGYRERVARLTRDVGLLRRYWSGEPLRFAGDEVTIGMPLPPVPVTIAAVSDRGMACAAAHAEVWEASCCTPAEFVELDRRFASTCSRRVTRSLEVDVFTGASRSAVAAALRRAETERGAAAMPEVRARALVGGPDEIAVQIEALAAAGVDQLLLAFVDPTDLRAMEAFAHRVIC